MEKLKQWVALTVLGCLAVLAAGWFLLVSPKRGEAAELRTQAAEQVSANAQLETQLQVLKAQAKELPKEQAKLAAVSTKIPDNPALPGLVRALLETAEGTGVELVSIAPGEPALVAPAAPATPVAPAAAGQAAPDPAGAPADPAGAPAAVPGGPAGQLAAIPVEINVVGDFFEVQQFLAALEGLPRALRFDTVAMSPGASPAAPEGAAVNLDDGRSLTTTLNGFVYMAANRPAAVTATVPGSETTPVEAASVETAPAPSADAAE